MAKRLSLDEKLSSVRRIRELGLRLKERPSCARRCATGRISSWPWLRLSPATRSCVELAADLRGGVRAVHGRSRHDRQTLPRQDRDLSRPSISSSTRGRTCSFGQRATCSTSPCSVGERTPPVRCERPRSSLWHGWATAALLPLLIDGLVDSEKRGPDRGGTGSGRSRHRGRDLVTASQSSRRRR